MYCDAKERMWKCIDDWISENVKENEELTSTIYFYQRDYVRLNLHSITNHVHKTATIDIEIGFLEQMPEQLIADIVEECVKILRVKCKP